MGYVDKLIYWISGHPIISVASIILLILGGFVINEYRSDKKSANYVGAGIQEAYDQIFGASEVAAPIEIQDLVQMPKGDPQQPFLNNTTDNSDFTKSLRTYSPELKNAYLGIPEFSNDNIIQDDELKMLDTAQFIYTHPAMKEVLEELGGMGDGKISRTASAQIDGTYYYHDPAGRQIKQFGITLDIHKPAHLMAFLEVLHDYNPENQKDFTDTFEKYGITDTTSSAAGGIHLNTIDEKYEAAGASEECGACIREGIKSLAHSLALERDHTLPWSIENYTGEEMKAVLMPRPSGGFGHGWTDAYPYAKKIIEGSKTHEEALEKIIDWSRKNMVHFATEPGFRMEDAYGNYNYSTYPLKNLLEYRTHVPVDQKEINYHIDNKIPIGATQGTGIIVGLSRSINVPAEEISPKQSHSNSYFPSLHKYSDGNWPVDIYVSKAPIKELLVDKATAENLFFSLNSQEELANTYVNHSLSIAKKYNMPITKLR
jgi:hypothetical protein